MTGVLLKNSFKQAQNAAVKLNSGQKIVAFLFLLLGIGLVLFVFSLFFFVFHYLKTSETGLGAVFYLLSQLFFLLFVLGVLSSTLAGLSSFWQGGEVRYLLTLPLNTNTVFHYLLVKQLVFNGWPLLVIGWPVTLSFVLALKIKLVTAVVLFFTLFPLLLTAEAFGAGTALVLGFFYRQLRSKWFLILLVMLALIFASRLANLITPVNLEKIVSQKVGVYDISFLKIKVNKAYLPSYWTAKVFQQALVSLNFTTFAYILTLTIIALVLLALVSFAGGAFYLYIWQHAYELASRPAKIKKSRLSWFKSAKGTIAERDLKLFSRNPDEIYQAVFIFLVVLLFLFIISKLPYLDITQPLWRYRLTLLLAGTISYFLAMLANRFAYPALSMEGRSFWLLLAAPFSLKDFYLSKLGSALIFVFLFVTVLFSLAAYYFVLPLKLGLLMYLQALMAAFTIVTLNLSLGGLYPDFTRRSAAEISSSLPALLAALFSVFYGILGMLALRPVARYFFLAQTANFTYFTLFLLLSLGISIWLLLLSLKKLAVFSL